MKPLDHESAKDTKGAKDSLKEVPGADIPAEIQNKEKLLVRYRASRAKKCLASWTA
jgi:hypothetical protein